MLNPLAGFLPQRNVISQAEVLATYYVCLTTLHGQTRTESFSFRCLPNFLSI